MEVSGKNVQSYAFIFPYFPNAKQVCRICNDYVAVSKLLNLRRHSESKHGISKWPSRPRQEAQHRNIEALTASYTHTHTHLFWLTYSVT
jgi:hypothetical protein